MPRARVGRKLALTLLVPLGSLIALTITEVVETSQRRDAVLEQTDLARASIGPAGLVTKLQNERIWAALDLLGFGGRIAIDVEGYDRTRRQTDTALRVFREQLRSTSATVRDSFASSLDNLGALDNLREEIDADDHTHDVNNIDFSNDVFSRYSALIGPLLDAAQDVSTEIDDQQLRVGVLLADAVTRQINTVQLVLEQAVLDVVLSPGGIDRRDEIIEIVDLRTDLVEQAQIMDSAWGAYADVDGLEASAELSRMVDDQVLFAIGANEVDLALLIDTLATPGDNPYFAYQASVGRIINDRADQLEAGADLRLRLMTTLAVLTLATAAAIFLLVSRAISRPLRSLTQQATAVARHLLPQAVMQVLATPPGTEVHMPKLDPVAVPSRDEVADVAGALNAVQASALDLAVGQAVLRRNIADALVNLGRRNQNLLSRQLELITQLEANETDRGVLESLFRLDHLATRTRRNAEGLLVLAELDSPRHWPSPVPLTDLIRSALGEVEDFHRAVVHSIGAVHVVGPAAIDLIHLLAELLENAFLYSPPDQAVEILGQRRPHGQGCTLALIDRGVGMPPDELARANRRLAGEERLTVAPSRYMGHYLAGKLARRHNIRVHLTDTPDGGTTAIIDLPEPLLTTPHEPPSPPPSEHTTLDNHPATP